MKSLAKGSSLPVPTGNDSAGGKNLSCCPAVLAVPGASGLEGCSQDQPEHRSAIKHPSLPALPSASGAAARGFVGASQSRHALTAERSQRKPALEKRAIPAPRLKLSRQLPRCEIRLQRVPPCLLPIRMNPAAPPSSLPFTN